MGMADGFFLLADQFARFAVAAGFHRVGVAGGFFLLADQLAALDNIAFVCVNVGRLRLRHRVAALAMGMGFYLGEETPEIAGFIIAGGIVLMHHKISVATAICAILVQAVFRMLVQAKTIQRAYRLALAPSRHLRIAFLCMDMLFFPTTRSSLHGNRRENQRVCGAEYHNAA